MQIKVCHLSSAHPAFDDRIFHKEAKTLSQAGYNVTIIAQHDKEEVVDGVKIIPLPRLVGKFERMTKVVWKLFRLALKEKAAIYHFHDPEIIPYGLVLRLLGKKVIYDVHEDYPETILSKQYIPSFLKRPVSCVLRVLENYSSKFFNFVITVTESIRDKFARHLSNVEIVKNYTSIKYAQDKVQKEHTGNVLEVIFAGGIYEERGIVEAVKAVNLLPELPIKFTLYGPVDEEFLRELKSLDGMNRLEYKGVVPYTEVLSRLKQADIGFLCDYPLKRHIESLPIKLFEYMAVGLASIVSRFPLWEEIVEGSHCGICVDPTSPEQMAEAMKYLYENPSERRQMGINGRKAILEKYNWEKEGRKLLNIYSRVLGDNNV
jgi:glycosyltransferase involved in cell wall biosynthesis